jgi:hypothetical protein
MNKQQLELLIQNTLEEMIGNEIVAERDDEGYYVNISGDAGETLLSVILGELEFEAGISLFEDKE